MHGEAGGEGFGRLGHRGEGAVLLVVVCLVAVPAGDGRWQTLVLYVGHVEGRVYVGSPSDRCNPAGSVRAPSCRSANLCPQTCEPPRFKSAYVYVCEYINRLMTLFVWT